MAELNYITREMLHEEHPEVNFDNCWCIDNEIDAVIRYYKTLADNLAFALDRQNKVNEELSTDLRELRAEITKPKIYDVKWSTAYTRNLHSAKLNEDEMRDLFELERKRQVDIIEVSKII